MSATVADLIAAIDAIAPFRLAESWDNVGLQVGDPAGPCRRVMVALEATPPVVAAAVDGGVDVLLVHHPLVFQPLRNLDETAPTARLVANLIRGRVALIAAHTNVDMVADGTNGEMADRLELRERRFLMPAAPTPDRFKYAVFVPATHVAAVIEAIAAAGAGVIGNYSHCTFRTPGTGTYRPLAGANPYAGEVGKLEEAADEVRLECVCPRQRLSVLIDAVARVHPYEEVAYDVWALESTTGAKYGLGLVGELGAPTTLGALAATCKRVFEVNAVAMVGEAARPIATVAVCSGAGGSAVRKLGRGPADVLVTGEMGHHDCAELLARGGAAILLGHHASEVIVGARMADRLRRDPRLAGVDIATAAREQAPECWV